MAKARSGIFNKISGSMDGTHFRQTRYGIVMALNGVPVNRKTSPKLTSTTRFSNASRLWAKVKPADVVAWNRLADTFIKTDKLGNSFPMRGLDLFRQVNRTRLEINEPVSLSAPDKIFPKMILIPRFDVFASKKLIDIRLRFKSAIPENTKIIVYATPMLKFGRNSPKPSQFRTIAILDFTFLSGFSLINEYLSVFPTDSVKSFRIAFKIKPVSCISGLSAPEFAVLQAPDAVPLILKIKSNKSVLNIKPGTRTHE
jgi:hypothetical protein